ncbi:hypothetical protein L2D00_13165 [Hyphomonadaceae bacterium BL14]|nr:hypothetical protein L2D00_13165 [Hyphomonadaceae bacterium BL14]
MTSSLRLLIAIFLASIAFVAGLTTGESTSGLTSRDNLSNAATFELEGSSDVGSYVRRIFAAGLFPDADITQGAGLSASRPMSVDQIETALSDPRLAALVGEGGEWTILLFADNSRFTKLQRGDELQGGWLVANITSVNVLLRRGDETRELPVFPTLDD